MFKEFYKNAFEFALLNKAQAYELIYEVLNIYKTNDRNYVFSTPLFSGKLFINTFAINYKGRDNGILNIADLLLMIRYKCYLDMNNKKPEIINEFNNIASKAIAKINSLPVLPDVRDYL